MWSFGGVEFMGFWRLRFLEVRSSGDLEFEGF